jgi:hypothetical protein
MFHAPSFLVLNIQVWYCKVGPSFMHRVFPLWYHALVLSINLRRGSYLFATKRPQPPTKTSIKSKHLCLKFKSCREDWCTYIHHRKCVFGKFV